MKLEILPVHHVPEIRPGMDLAGQLRHGIVTSGVALRSDDILAVTQKVVSKAEGRIVRLAEVVPSEFSRSVASQMKKDPRLIEVILGESRRIVRMRGDVLICETHHGFICANAGVDRSNVEDSGTVTLLPKDPDRSASQLAHNLGCGVIITDTVGRPWREGLVDTAIGIARVAPLLDYRGKPDSHGRTMHVTLFATADALAAAAGLVMEKTANTPGAVIRGFPWQESNATSRALIRPREADLFL